MTRRVDMTPVWWLLGGVVGLAAIDRIASLSIAGWIVGAAYLAVSNALLMRGLRASHARRFGPANTATALRSTLAGIAAALITTSFTASIPVALLVAIVIPALALDAVDGWLARRTRTATALGARFDMEVDSFLVLMLSIYAMPIVGWWVLLIGLFRYAYLVATWVLPWLRRPVPARYWGKVVAAYAGIALTAVASGLLPFWADVAVCAVALALLVESFGHDIVWQASHRHDPESPGRTEAGS